MSRSLASSGIALCAFCVFGTLAAGLSCIALLAPGHALDLLWRINPRAHEDFARMGGWAPVLLAAVASACALCAVGLLMQRRWAYRMMVAGIAINLFADLTNALGRGDLRTLVGVPIAAALLAWLLRPRTRERLAPS